MATANNRSSSAKMIRGDLYQIGRFEAMASPCEILIDTDDAVCAKTLVDLAAKEAKRIENQFSRYRAGNIVDQINHAAGRPITVDEETARLLDYAAQCFEISDGLFDITTGILREVWRFDGAEVRMDAERFTQVRAKVGWDRVNWKRPVLEMPRGFEIDLGGIGKEYAADRILKLLRAETEVSLMVNLGGDIAAAGDRAWSVGIDDVTRPDQIAETFHLTSGGVATSGTTKRYARFAGKTWGHILNPKSGWPVQNAPASVTVAAKSCTEAGFWSTLAVLNGSNAEQFLKVQQLESWCYRRPTPARIIESGDAA